MKDPSGAALSNVSVSAINIDTGVPIGVKTDAEGNYIITPLHISAVVTVLCRVKQLDYLLAIRTVRPASCAE